MGDPLHVEMHTSTVAMAMTLFPGAFQLPILHRETLLTVQQVNRLPIENVLYSTLLSGGDKRGFGIEFLQLKANV